jgi:hypothetical protein
MGMVTEQGPRVAGSRASQQKVAKPIKKTIPVLIITENLPPFNPSDYHMVHRSCSIYS